MIRFRNQWEGLRSSFWFVPLLMAFLAIAASLVMGHVDRSVSSKFAASLGWIYTGGPQGARGVLSAIASSVIGVAGTTFSIVIAVLSLTSGQFGPRLLRNFMRDIGNQIVLGTFTATFLYCILVLRTIRGTDDDTYVPNFSITVGVALAVLSVGVLIYFVNHIAKSIQVSHLVETVGADTDYVLGERFRPRGEAPLGGAMCSVPADAPAIVTSSRIGYVQSIDEDGIVQLARAHSLVIRVEVRAGDYLLPDANLFSVWPATTDHDSALRQSLSCGGERTTQQDVEFAFLQLAEVAVRALSPGINDPFTAMLCIDRITASMCLAVKRAWPATCRVDETGSPRMFVKVLSPTELVAAAYGHIRHAAKDSPAVLASLVRSVELVLPRVHDASLRAALRGEGPS